MYPIKSLDSNSTITVEYEDFNNMVSVHVGNETGFRFVNLDAEQIETLIECLTDAKNMIV